MRIHIKWFLFTLLFCSIFVFWQTYKEVLFRRKKIKSYGEVVANTIKGLWEITPNSTTNNSLPEKLQKIPLAETEGIVLGSKEIAIRNVIAPYNPSMIEYEEGHLLIFRYDVLKPLSASRFHSYIGCVQLDRNFNQTSEEFKTINTGSKYSEDPRIVRVGKDLYLFFNDQHPCGKENGRTMRVAKFDPKNAKLEFITNLEVHIQRTEKNWVPFEFIEENSKPELYIEYFINPHKILKLSNPSISALEHLSFPQSPSFQTLSWTKKWGAPRGGTTARKIGNQYVGFFHSCITEKNNSHWYVMGAYTFEATPPFRINSISRYPILFDGMYSAPLTNTAASNKQVIFPAGFSIEEKEGKILLHVACGENDCAIKIVTIDGTNLLKSLKKL